MNNNVVIVFTSNTARKLLKLGYTIVDIKPDKNDPDRKRSVYIFKEEPGIKNIIKKLIYKKEY